MATFQNQATLNYRGLATNSNIVTGEIVEAVSATKSSVGTTYRTDGTMTYIVSLLNAGGTAANDLTVTDDLGAYTFGAGTIVPLSYIENSLRYYVNGVLQAATPTVTAGPPLVISGITIPAGGNALIVYDTRLTDAANPGVGGTITNTATVTGDAIGTIPVTATATVNAVEEADLDISKAISAATVTVGDPLTYTFTITNNGNTAADAADNISVADTFDPILENLVVTLGGQTLTEGTDYTYNAATGEFATVPGRITVPAATITQDTTTGNYITSPGITTLTVTGTV